MIVDAHVRVGHGREASLTVPDLLDRMDRLGIDVACVAPDEAAIAYENRRGNATTTAAAAASRGRLVAYAVANPWRGGEAVAELERARDAGARALAVDSVLQGFDLLDGLVDPLLRFASDQRWPVYVRTGTPPNALPLTLALLARRFPEVTFIMGRSGATDFWIDAAEALRSAPNLLGDTSYAPWDTLLSELGSDPAITPSRLVFSTDQPYTVAESEVRRIRDWPITDRERSLVLGGTLRALLAL
ncbi:amidohydrolase family protein [Jiangella rhizosphaerae]|uniref:Amidohydrolase n=1 Tax=Jiangella rhizosphaerae TaxID=2293569 RepID=A0A418KL23_9ACTN|nr:amidohydrolase family protein [Jiangella rhizosphaerae]RIQ17871.1 amidohydrolase [Jiangella rhizosphaerae]